MGLQRVGYNWAHMHTHSLASNISKIVLLKVTCVISSRTLITLGCIVSVLFFCKLPISCDPWDLLWSLWTHRQDVTFGSFLFSVIFQIGEFLEHSSVQLFSHVRLFATPWTAAHQASLSITNSQSLLKLMFIESVMPSSNCLILGVSFSSCLQSFPASGSFPRSQFLASGGQSIRASASVLPMNIQDWFPLGWTAWISLQLQRDSQKSLLQHHSSKASILRHSAFFIVQFSHPY